MATSKRPVQPVLAIPEEIAIALGKYYGLHDNTVETMLSTVSSASSMSTLSTMSNLSSLDTSLGSLGSLSGEDLDMSSLSIEGMDFDDSGSGGIQTEGMEDGDGNDPVIKYVNQMIMEAYRLRASDIHVEPGKFDLKVRYRIDGVLHRMPPPPDDRSRWSRGKGSSRFRRR